MCFTISELLYQSYLKTQTITIENTSIFHKTYYPSLLINLIILQFLYIIKQ